MKFPVDRTPQISINKPVMSKTKAEQLYEMGRELVAHEKELPDNFADFFKGYSSQKEFLERVHHWQEGISDGVQILQDRDNQSKGLPTAAELNKKWDQRDRDNTPPTQKESFDNSRGRD